MIKITLIVTFTLLSLFTYSQVGSSKDSIEFNHHCRFEENSFVFGVGAPYSLDLVAAGINLRGYYSIGETICFGPEFSMFSKGESQVYDFNAVAHNIFETKIVEFYTLVFVLPIQLSRNKQQALKQKMHLDLYLALA
jgi:hypothetical protein